jgi:hypothetical protein
MACPGLLLITLAVGTDKTPELRQYRFDLSKKFLTYIDAPAAWRSG